MTESKFEELMNLNYLDDEYSDYIINHTSARIGNGDMLIEAIESGVYYEGFKDHMLGDKSWNL